MLSFESTNPEIMLAHKQGRHCGQLRVLHHPWIAGNECVVYYRERLPIGGAYQRSVGVTQGGGYLYRRAVKLGKIEVPCDGINNRVGVRASRVPSHKDAGSRRKNRITRRHEDIDGG